MLDHVWKALQTGGRLVVLDRIVPAESSSLDPEQHGYQVSPEAVQEQLLTKGFEIVERRDRFVLRPNGERWWLIVARKPG